MQEFCCPSPNNPVISPNSEALKHRMFLKYLCYGECAIILTKLLLFGIFAGIMQLITLWLIYSCYAKMHYCNCIIIMICCGMDLIFAYLSYSKISEYLQGEYLITSILWAIMIYDLIAIIIAARAMKCFKTLFTQQHPSQGGAN